MNSLCIQNFSQTFVYQILNYLLFSVKYCLLFNLSCQKVHYVTGNAFYTFQGRRYHRRTVCAADLAQHVGNIRGESYWSSWFCRMLL